MRQEQFRRYAAEMPALPLRLERRVPLALLCAIIMQCSGAVAWATYMEARMEAVEHAQVEQSGLREEFARLEERIDSLRADIARLQRQVEKVLDER